MIEIIKESDMLRIAGPVDAEGAEALDRALRACSGHVVLDFAKVSHITSTGLKRLLFAMKGGLDLSVVNVSPAVGELFHANGYDNMLTYSVNESLPPSDYVPVSTEKSFKAMLAAKQVPGMEDRMIINYRDRDYTWKDVEMCSQIMADDLARLGVKKGSHVAIIGLNSINWFCAFFAVQKLGAIAILMNYFLSPEEIIGQSKIGDIEFMIVGRIPGVSDFDVYSSLVTAGDSRIRKTYNIRDSHDYTTRYDEYPAVKDLYRDLFDEDDACLMLFTSGSTGLAKGAVFSSKAIFDCIFWVLDEYLITSEDRNCISLPFFHILGFAIMFVIAIKCDSPSYIPETATPAAIQSIIEKNRCTMFHSVPTMLLAVINNKNFTPDKVASLRCSILGGAVTSSAQMELMTRMFPNNHMGNIYGMSENPAISITLLHDSTERVLSTVGKPLPHIQMEIRNHGDNKPLPLGQVGEICIRAATSLTSYYNLPLANQAYDSEGWIATGDLGMMDEEGYLYFSGRVKELIIRCGENIIPKEISELLITHPDISQAIVVGVPHPLYGEDVAAAVVMEPGKTLDENAIRDFLWGKLAKFKLPAHYRVYDSFPVLGSGKPDLLTLKKQVAESYAAAEEAKAKKHS